MRRYLLGTTYFTLSKNPILEAVLTGLEQGIGYVYQHNYGYIKLFPTKLIARLYRNKIQTIGHQDYPLFIYSITEIIGELGRKQVLIKLSGRSFEPVTTITFDVTT